MITSFDIYLISLLDNVIGLFGGISALLITTIIFFIFLFVSENEENSKEIFGYVKKTSICLIISTTIYFFTPSTKTMVATIVTPKIINNENINKIPESLVNFIDNYKNK